MALGKRIGFRGRLVTAMVTLVAVVSLSIGALMMLYLFEDEKARAIEKLGLGEQISDEVFTRRTRLILSRLDVVVKDFGFRSALASGDRTTAESALDNQTRRLGAEFSRIIASNGDILASAGSPPDNLQERTEALELLSKARSSGFASQYTVLDGQAIELVAIPVKAAGLRVHLVAGFGFGPDLKDVIERLSGAEVLFRSRKADQDNFHFLSNVDDMEQGRLNELSRNTAVASGNARFVESPHYFTRILTLADNPTGKLQLVLLINRDASLAAYYKRAVEIFLLVSGVLILAALIALFVARSMGKPVLQLADYAKAIGDGGSPTPPNIRAGGELSELQKALGDMSVKLKDREEQIRYAASHDEITGLPNNNAFLASVRDVFREGRRCRIFGVRINDLPNINDTLGLAFGDKVLGAVSERLKATLPENSEVARTGGSEFLILTDAVEGKQLDELAERLYDVVQAPLDIDRTPFSLRCLMVSLQLPTDAGHVDQVRRRLNLTFEVAQNQRHKITYYQPGRDEDHLRELQIISDLNAAIADKGLHMNYQPKLKMANGEMVQVEALVRWIHPELGFISPEEFIFLAEQSGQINDLTRHILRRVAQDASLWHANGLNLGIAINLSTLDLTRPELPAEVADAFSDWPLPMSRITLEVTESALMEDPETALNTLNKLRDLGVTLSVDDFGTGYSSLSQLRKLPVQELKIDKSFVLKLNNEPQDQLIVKSTIDMAHGLGLKVVAEGIENRESWHLLRDWGCETGQGFYMSRPVGAGDLIDTVAALRKLQPELESSGETT